MTERIKGIVTAVSQKEGKYGVALGKDNWFNGYGECPCKKEDNVEITYEVNKGFKNIDQVYVNKEEPEIKKESKIVNKKVIYFENRHLSEIINELNKLDTIATQFYPKGVNYDVIVWLK